MQKFTTKDIVKKYDFKFTKSLGQNFLIDDTVLDDIVEGANIKEEDFIIEIGPGVGTLTKVLLEKGNKVTAIELDSRLISILQKELGAYENFNLIHNDALRVNFNELIGESESVKFVANLPYYVTTPIISTLIKGNFNFKSLTIMIQKEVAERIAAKPSCKEYGALTLLVQYYCDVTVIRHVPPTAFIPMPKVESMVIRLDKLDKPRVELDDEELFFKVIRDSFNMRRKTLWNGLKNIGKSKEILEKSFEESKIDQNRRGETLSIQEFAALANSISHNLK